MPLTDTPDIGLRPQQDTDVAVAIQNLHAVAERHAMLAARFQAWADKVRGLNTAGPQNAAPPTPTVAPVYDNGLLGGLQRHRDKLCESANLIEGLLDSMTSYI